MDSFSFKAVEEVIFSRGAALDLSDYCLRLGMTRPIFVTDPGLVQIGLVSPVFEKLEAVALEPQLFDQVKEDPPEETVCDGLEYARKTGVDGVIGFGGGSSMDVAKVLAVLLGGDQTLSELYGVEQVTNSRLPLILIPTTAGTGSEVTPVAVITTGKTTKAGVSSSVLLPDIALLDPNLTLGLPSNITAMTGVDAMVHAIEAYTSRHKKNPMSDGLSVQALKLLSENIRTAVSDGEDLEAREGMLLGSMLAGQAFANSPVAAVHALAYPLGGHYHIPHGLSNSLVLPAVLEFNMPKAYKLYAELAEVIIPEAVAGSMESKARSFLESMRQIILDVELPPTLEKVNIPETDLEMLAAEAMLQQRLLINNPREVTEENALNIYQSAYR